VFKHQQGADATTWPTTSTFKDIEVISEFYGSTLDGTGENRRLTTRTRIAFYLEPRATTTTVPHILYFENVKVSGGYNGITQSRRWIWRARPHEAASEAVRSYQLASSPASAATNDDWDQKWYVAEDCYFHDTDPNVGSHLNYWNAQVNISHTRNKYDNWRSAKYGFQNWGTASLGPHHETFTDCWFGSGGLGIGILTNERATCQVSDCTFECKIAMEIRTTTTIKGGYVRMKPGGTGFATYADCQYGAHIQLDGVVFNMVDVGLSPPQGCVVVDHPVKMHITNCKSIALDANQSNLSVPLSVNAGNFLVVHTGSEGGYVLIDGLLMTHDVVNGSSQAIMAFLAASGADVKIRDSRFVGRCPTVGAIRIDGRTAGSLELYDNDINPTTGKAVFGGATTAANILSGRGNKFHGKGCTFSTSTQHLRFREEAGPDVATASTAVWDPDYDYARFTGTTTVSTLNITGTSQLGYHGAIATIYAVSGFSTDTAGNFLLAYTVAAGQLLVVRYDAVAAKWVKVGSETDFKTTLQTTDATPTAMASVPLADNTVYYLRAEVAYRDTAGVERGVLSAVACVYRQGGGSATLQGTQQVLHPDVKTSGTAALAIVVSGNNAVLQATGIVATTIDWVADCSVRGVT
jgi:hypothetical protein